MIYTKKLWRGESTSWPEEHPGHKHYSSYRNDLEFDVVTDYPLTINVFLSRINTCKDTGKDLPTHRHTGVGIWWKFKFNYDCEYYDGEWNQVNVGPFYFSWFR